MGIFHFLNLNLNFEFWPIGYWPKPEPVRTGLTGNRSNRTGSHRFGEPCVGEAEKVAMVVDLDDWTSPFDTLTHQLLIELIIFFVVHMLISGVFRSSNFFSARV